MVSGNRQKVTDKQVVDKILERLAEAEQPLPTHLELYRRALIAQSQTIMPDLSPSLTALKDKVSRQTAQGKPMLTFDDLGIDWAEMQILLQQVVRLTNEYLSPAPEESEELDKLSKDFALLRKAAKTWFEAGVGSDKGTESKGMSPLTTSVLQATLNPLLAAYACELLPLLDAETWHQRYCPICKGNPDFAFLDKEKGARWLLCSRCDAQWLFPRLVCPHCGNDDQKTLAFFTDDKGLYRLYVCDKCRHYLKAIDLRKTDAEILLPLERVLTLDMDRQAQEMKYQPVA